MDEVIQSIEEASKTSTMIELVIKNKSTKRKNITFPNEIMQKLSNAMGSLNSDIRISKKHLKKTYHMNTELTYIVKSNKKDNTVSRNTRHDERSEYDDPGKITQHTLTYFKKMPRCLITGYTVVVHPIHTFSCNMSHNEHVDIKQTIFRMSNAYQLVLESKYYEDSTVDNNVYIRVYPTTSNDAHLSEKDRDILMNCERVIESIIHT